MKQQLNVLYDQQYDLRTDVYLPDKPTATIIDIHGGGWFRGDKSKDADWAQRLTKLGYVVVVPNYRMTPEAYYPAPLEDMDQLMSWLNHQPFPKQLAAVGGSAGGNMAIELAIKYGIPAVSLSGIIDIEEWLAHHEAVDARQGDTSQFNHQASAEINQTGSNDEFYKWFVTNYFDGRTDQYHLASPAYRVTDTTGPMYLANSLNEFVPNSGVQQIATAMSENQVPFTMRLLTGQRHGKGYLDDVFDDVVAFLARNLG